jgi:hypothetical protein
VTTDELVAAFASISDRAALIAFLAPLRLSKDLSEFERARVTRALIAAAARAVSMRPTAAVVRLADHTRERH